MSIVDIFPKRNYPVAQDLNGATKEWEMPHYNPRRSLQDCEDTCRTKNGCLGFEYAKRSSDQDQGACGIYTGGDDDERPDSVWYRCVKSTLPGE